MTLPKMSEWAKKYKETTHEHMTDMAQVFEFRRGDQIVAVVASRPFMNDTEKHAVLTEMLFFRTMSQSDRMIMVSDAFLSKARASDVDSDDFVRPSEDPEATECLMVLEFKGSDVIASGELPYRIDDDGTLVWLEPTAAYDEIAHEGWIFDLVRHGWAIKKPTTLHSQIHEDATGGLWLQARGHTVVMTYENMMMPPIDLLLRSMDDA